MSETINPRGCSFRAGACRPGPVWTEGPRISWQSPDRRASITRSMACYELNLPADGRAAPTVAAELPPDVPRRPARNWWACGIALTFVASLCAAAAIAWYSGLRYRFVPINFGVVEAGKDAYQVATSKLASAL